MKKPIATSTGVSRLTSTLFPINGISFWMLLAFIIEPFINGTAKISVNKLIRLPTGRKEKPTPRIMAT